MSDLAISGTLAIRTSLAAPRVVTEVAVLPLTILAFEEPEGTSGISHRVTLWAPFVIHDLAPLFVHRFFYRDFLAFDEEYYAAILT